DTKVLGGRPSGRKLRSPVCLKFMVEKRRGKEMVNGLDVDMWIVVSTFATLSHKVDTVKGEIAQTLIDVLHLLTKMGIVQRSIHYHDAALSGVYDALRSKL
ncbi:unnamed protein product, partial [Tilletia caries]